MEDNLKDLHERVHSGDYRAKPSRRAYIPKADGRLRPLGIASLEDKIVQRAVVEVLNAIYEEDFLGFSYGFRSRRGPHHGLDALAVGILRKKVNWVLDADIRDFFATLDQAWLVKFHLVRFDMGSPSADRGVGLLPFKRGEEVAVCDPLLTWGEVEPKSEQGRELAAVATPLRPVLFAGNRRIVGYGGLSARRLLRGLRLRRKPRLSEAPALRSTPQDR